MYNYKHIVSHAPVTHSCVVLMSIYSNNVITALTLLVNNRKGIYLRFHTHFPGEPRLASSLSVLFLQLLPYYYIRLMSFFRGRPG